MSANLKKIEIERNRFIKNMSQEQFDGVITSKYRKLFTKYFNGAITSDELTKKDESYRELINVYDVDKGKIDTNQYIYHALVDVASELCNVINSHETCFDKVNLLACYFQLVVSCESKLKYLQSTINDVFFINENFKDCDAYLESKKVCVGELASRLDLLFGELAQYEDVIKRVEDESHTNFIDERCIDDNIKNMYKTFKNASESMREEFMKLQNDCVDDTGARLDIMTGILTSGEC